MQHNTLLIEIGTEELPPKSLKKLSNSFKQGIQQGLEQHFFTFKEARVFATPRRLAVLIKEVSSHQPSHVIEKKGPPLSAAFDKQGNPTVAALKFAESVNLSIPQLEHLSTDKGTWLIAKIKQPGQSLHLLIKDIIYQALKTLPVAKYMRWGNYSTEFIRPVHWVVLLYGSELIETEILGKPTTRETQGHRFHSSHALPIPADPLLYEEILFKQGKVIADYQKREALIKQEISRICSEKNATAIMPDHLIEEVAALVEWPVVLLAQFADHFLNVPKEALMSAMQNHQKCFPLVSQAQQLIPYFITVSNIESRDQNLVIHGNERVMRARLNDAQFFYQSDCKYSLEHYQNLLKNVIFQAKLGNLFEKSARIAKLTHWLSHFISGEQALAERAATLCKADLMTDMVGEFPELQGTMGYYYALTHHEPEAVAIAIRDHYLPRFAKDDLPISLLACSIAIADRIDTLVGLFGIHKTPSGEKDPFGLRRNAIGLLRIIIEKELPIDLLDLLKAAFQGYQAQLPNKNVVDEVYAFLLERLKMMYVEKGINPKVFTAVMAKNPSQLYDFHQRLQAVWRFTLLPAAESLTQANKRVSKLLSKEGNFSITCPIHSEFLIEDAEKKLAAILQQQAHDIKSLLETAQYEKALNQLASLKEPVDYFFDTVMVMVDNEKIRNNRLALLANLRDLFFDVADFSLL